MTDEQQTLLDKENDSEKEEDERDCCFYTGQWVLCIVRELWHMIKFVIMTVMETLGLCWYPLKERVNDCCDNCDARMNPETDPSYTGF